MRRIVYATLVISLAALLTAAAAVAGNGGFLPGEPHSPNAHRVHQTFIFTSIFTGLIFLLVEGSLIAFIVKYRRGKRARTVEGPQIHGATKLEIIWTVIPVIILATIGTFLFYKLPGIEHAPTAAAADQTTITVEGHQFYWMFRYPNGAVSINTMYAPAEKVVNERIVGLPWDVIHSWWVPDFGGKYDAIPGKVNRTWFKAPAGTYQAGCYELCGIQHAQMQGLVKVVPPAQYEQFITNRRANAASKQVGKEEFEGVCQKCHALDHKYIGPALQGNPLLGDVNGITTLLRQGQGMMPPVGRNWSNKQIQALVAYTTQFSKGGS